MNFPKFTVFASSFFIEFFASNNNNIMTGQSDILMSFGFGFKTLNNIIENYSYCPKCFPMLYFFCFHDLTSSQIPFFLSSFPFLLRPCPLPHPSCMVVMGTWCGTMYWKLHGAYLLNIIIFRRYDLQKPYRTFSQPHLVTGSAADRSSLWCVL